MIQSFHHEDGERLAASFRERHPALRRLVEQAREDGLPIVYANDNCGAWDSDFPAQLAEAVTDGLAGDLVATIAPRGTDRVIVKPRYSAFRMTPLELILDELGPERLLLAGTATEMCVAQTAIDAREAGYKVSVVAEACSSVDEENEALALRYLESVAGVRIETVDEVLAVAG